MKPDFEDDATICASVPFRFPEDEPPAPQPATDRAAVIRGLVELLLSGRTNGARLLRLAALDHLLNPGEPIARIARRVGVSPRRFRQALAEVRNFTRERR